MVIEDLGSGDLAPDSIHSIPSKIKAGAEKIKEQASELGKATKEKLKNTDAVGKVISKVDKQKLLELLGDR